jgi:hypothetical protein
VYTGRALLPFFEFERWLTLDTRLDAVEEKLALGRYTIRG